MLDLIIGPISSPMQSMPKKSPLNTKNRQLSNSYIGCDKQNTGKQDKQTGARDKAATHIGKTDIEGLTLIKLPCTGILHRHSA